MWPSARPRKSYYKNYTIFGHFPFFVALRLDANWRLATNELAVQTLWLPLFTLLASVFSSSSFESCRWRDYDGGIQLLDDLCRQISQKERREQVYAVWQSTSTANRKRSFICALLIFIVCLRQPVFKQPSKIQMNVFHFCIVVPCMRKRRLQKTLNWKRP